MKIRKGFVSNSSSSSFVIINAGDENIVEDGDTCHETYHSISIPIDRLIEQLISAKNNGVTDVEITHGGGYEG